MTNLKKWTWRVTGRGSRPVEITSVAREHHEALDVAKAIARDIWPEGEIMATLASVEQIIQGPWS